MPSRLQLAELEQLLAASDALSFMAESAGARPVLTVRNAIQLQCKTFLEDMHTHSITQLIGKALMTLTCSTIPQSDPACLMALALMEEQGCQTEQWLHSWEAIWGFGSYRTVCALCTEAGCVVMQVLLSRSSGLLPWSHETSSAQSTSWSRRRRPSSSQTATETLPTWRIPSQPLQRMQGLSNTSRMERAAPLTKVQLHLCWACTARD